MMKKMRFSLYFTMSQQFYHFWSDESASKKSCLSAKSFKNLDSKAFMGRLSLGGQKHSFNDWKLVYCYAFFRNFSDSGWNRQKITRLAIVLLTWEGWGFETLGKATLPNYKNNSTPFPGRAAYLPYTGALIYFGKKTKIIHYFSKWNI